MDDVRITRVEWGRLTGRRPRSAGSNARLGDHGVSVTVPIARLTAQDGFTGFGVSHGPAHVLDTLLGARLGDLFAPGLGVADAWLGCDYPIWDLAARRAGVPVYALAAASGGQIPTEPFRARCYDTSLYFDDLHLPDDRAAAALLAAEAREGYERGHRSFKIKVGRGARHMPTEEGMRRDIAVVRAVREAVGSEAVLMLDANDGYTLNHTKRVLAETADCEIFWMEEPFREDHVLYQDLRTWMEREGLPVLIADGEGEPSSSLLDWARAGLVDVVQYDIFAHGFSRWIQTGRLLDGWGVRTAPHHYGGHWGNYAACHLAGAIERFAYAEWDDAATPGLAASGYTVRDGWVEVPDALGFGLELDEQIFRHAVEDGGYSRTA